MKRVCAFLFGATFGCLVGIIAGIVGTLVLRFNWAPPRYTPKYYGRYDYTNYNKKKYDPKNQYGYMD